MHASSLPVLRCTRPRGAVPRVLRFVVPALPFLLLGGAGCGSSTSAGPQSASAARSETLDHEACDDQGGHVESLDMNGDGRPDVRRVFDRAPGESGARELCRIVDLNHDGRPDLYEYFDRNGAVRRREFCYDDTGIVNAIELYRDGKLESRVYDTTGQHRIDTWDWFDPKAPVDAKTGRPKHPIRRERDVRGDGRIDQWWTWNGDRVDIATDRNGDGMPDTDSLITLGADPLAGPVSPATPEDARTDAGSSRDGGAP